MTKLLEQVVSQAAELPPDQQEVVAQRWLEDLRLARQERGRLADELSRVIDQAAGESRPDQDWRFSREETYRERLDRYPR